jgi:hypothetical protein
VKPVGYPTPTTLSHVPLYADPMTLADGYDSFDQKEEFGEQAKI